MAKTKTMRTFTDKERLAILKECEENGTNAAMQKHNISSSLIHAWRKKYNITPPKRKKSPTNVPADNRSVKDAIIFLKEAKRNINARMARSNGPNRADLLALLALSALLGE